MQFKQIRKCISPEKQKFKNDCGHACIIYLNRVLSHKSVDFILPHRSKKLKMSKIFDILSDFKCNPTPYESTKNTLLFNSKNSIHVVLDKEHYYIAIKQVNKHFFCMDPARGYCLKSFDSHRIITHIRINSTFLKDSMNEQYMFILLIMTFPYLSIE